MPMPSASADHRKVGKPHTQGAPPPEQEHLLCPRCDSVHTKFCYYNNYNFSQPRYFCKSCRRYWTHGGTLRDIPFGGGSRKNSKRSRTIPSTPSLSVSTVTHFINPHPLAASTVPRGSTVSHGSSIQFPGGGNVKQNDLRGSFTFLLNTQGPDFLALGGLGLGLGTQMDDGFGVARGGWSFSGVGDGGTINASHAIGSGIGNTWALDNGDAVFAAADCFHWPDLAISSTAGNGVK